MRSGSPSLLPSAPTASCYLGPFAWGTLKSGPCPRSVGTLASAVWQPAGLPPPASVRSLLVDTPSLLASPPLGFQGTGGAGGRTPRNHCLRDTGSRDGCFNLMIAVHLMGCLNPGAQQPESSHLRHPNGGVLGCQGTAASQRQSSTARPPSPPTAPRGEVDAWEKPAQSPSQLKPLLASGVFGASGAQSQLVIDSPRLFPSPGLLQRWGGA